MTLTRDTLREAPELQRLFSWVEPKCAPESSSRQIDPPPFKHADFRGWTPLARGPSLKATKNEDGHDTWLWWHEESNRPFFAMNEKTPPTLFVPIASVAELERRAEDFTRPRASGARTGHIRMALGLIQHMIVIENRLVLDAFMNSFPLRLGTAAKDADDLVLVQSTFQTRYSASSIALSGWGGLIPNARVLTAQITYAPAEDGAIVRLHNEAVDGAFPEDVPLDVLGALNDIRARTPEQLMTAAQSPEEPEPKLAFLFAMLLKMDDPAAALAETKKWRNHPVLGQAASSLEGFVKHFSA